VLSEKAELAEEEGELLGDDVVVREVEGLVGAAELGGAPKEPLVLDVEGRGGRT